MDWLGDVTHRALKAHGVEFDVTDDGAALLANGLRIFAQISEHTDHGHSHVLRMDFILYGGPLGDRLIRHCLAGTGDTIEAARWNGAEKFLNVAFHTVLEALADHSCEHPQANWEKWTGPSGNWKVAISPLLRTGTEATASLSLASLLDDLKIEFLAHARAGVQFIDVFFAHLNGERYASEAKLNGEEWPEGLARLESWHGSTSQAYSTGRFLLIASPAG